MNCKDEYTVRAKSPTSIKLAKLWREISKVDQKTSVLSDLLIAN